MEVTQNQIKEILEILAETPKRFALASKHLTKNQLQTKPDPNTWSANDILAHLRACADVWGKDIDDMLEIETPKLRYLSPRTWMRKTNYPELAFGASFPIYMEQRTAFLLKLKAIKFEDWLRDAIIKDRSHSVFTHTRRMALHEEGHWGQIQDLFKNN